VQLPFSSGLKSSFPKPSLTQPQIVKIKELYREARSAEAISYYSEHFNYTDDIFDNNKSSVKVHGFASIILEI